MDARRVETTRGRLAAQHDSAVGTAGVPSATETRTRPTPARAETATPAGPSISRSQPRREPRSRRSPKPGSTHTVPHGRASPGQKGQHSSRQVAGATGSRAGHRSARGDRHHPVSSNRTSADRDQQMALTSARDSAASTQSECKGLSNGFCPNTEPCRQRASRAKARRPSGTTQYEYVSSRRISVRVNASNVCSPLAKP